MSCRYLELRGAIKEVYEEHAKFWDAYGSPEGPPGGIDGKKLLTALREENNFSTLTNLLMELGRKEGEITKLATLGEKIIVEINALEACLGRSNKDRQLHPSFDTTFKPSVQFPPPCGVVPFRLPSAGKLVVRSPSS